MSKTHQEIISLQRKYALHTFCLTMAHFQDMVCERTDGIVGARLWVQCYKMICQRMAEVSTAEFIKRKRLPSNREAGQVLVDLVECMTEEVVESLQEVEVQYVDESLERLGEESESYLYLVSEVQRAAKAIELLEEMERAGFHILNEQSSFDAGIRDIEAKHCMFGADRVVSETQDVPQAIPYYNLSGESVQA